MTPQPTPTEQLNAQDLSTHEAFVSLLIAAARADGTVSAHEANSIEHIVSGMRLFRDCRGETLHRVFDAAAGRIKDDGLTEVVQTAAAIIPGELRATAFAHAVDLMMADGRLSAQEERFADDLGALLNVDADEAAKIIDVLRIKNAG